MTTVTFTNMASQEVEREFPGVQAAQSYVRSNGFEYMEGDAEFAEYYNDETGEYAVINL